MINNTLHYIKQCNKRYTKNSSSSLQDIEMVAPPPLVPFTEEPLSLVGNPASWVSLMCPLCLEILSPVELVIVVGLCLPHVVVLGLKSDMSFCVPVVKCTYWNHMWYPF